MADKPLGNLFVRVAADVSNFTRGMSNVEKQANRAKTKLAAFRASPVATGAALAAFGVIATKVALDLAKAGAASEEADNKFRATLGAFQGKAREALEEFREFGGVTTSEGQDIIATTANMALGMGLAQDAAAELGVAALRASGDLASFSNVPIERTALAVQRGLTGETEALKGLGVVLKATDITTRALADSNKLLAKELTGAEIIAARMVLIQEGMGAAMGDAERTAGSNARQMVILSSNVSELKDRLALAASNGMTPFITALNVGSRAVLNFFERIKFGKTEAEKLAAELNRITHLVQATDEAWLGALNALNEYNLAMERIAARTAAAAEETEDANKVVQNFGRFGRTAAEHIGFLNTQVRDVKVSLTLVEATLGTASKPLRRMAGEWIPDLTDAIQTNVDTTNDSFIPALDKTGDAAFSTAQKIALVASAVVATARILKSNASAFTKFRRVLGSIASAVGFALALSNPALGAALIGAGQLVALKDGGPLKSGQVGLVGEEGPELITGPGQVHPMGGAGGPIHISIVTETGRKLVDTITIKQGRDRDLRRVIRIPAALVATG